MKAIVIGIVQGLTEFLPISSTAHIRIVPALLGWEDPGAAFTAVIQLGTVLAVLIYFAKDLGRAITGWARSLGGKDKDSVDARMGWAVFYGTIPVIIVGLLLRKQIKTDTFRSLYVIAFSMIAMAIVMLIAEKMGKRDRGIETVQPKDGIRVGLWQCLALIPGMSRSGSTISGALFDGFDYATAARFSFLMSVPSVAGAGLYEFWDERKNIVGDQLMYIGVATVVSFVVGYACIAWLIKLLQTRGIGIFVWYRLALGIVLLILLQQGTLKPQTGNTKSEPAKVASR